MTYVEFFDSNSVDNILSSLTSAPRRVILVGGENKAMRAYKERYEKLFANRGYNIEFICNFKIHQLCHQQ